MFCNLKIVNKLVIQQLYNINILEYGKKEFLKDEFTNEVIDIRNGGRKDYKVIDGKANRKIKAVKSIKGGRYIEVNKKLFYELLDTNSKHFKRDIINKVDEKELGIKFESETIRVYP